MAITYLSPIEKLSINDKLHLNQLNALLSYVSQLRYLSLHHLYQHRDEQIKFNPMMLKHLTHVSLNIIEINFDTFEFLIINLSEYIEVLHISTENDFTYMNANRWQKLILSHMSHLRVFDIFYCHHENADIFIFLMD